MGSKAFEWRWWIQLYKCVQVCSPWAIAGALPVHDPSTAGPGAVGPLGPGWPLTMDGLRTVVPVLDTLTFTAPLEDRHEGTEEEDSFIRVWTKARYHTWTQSGCSQSMCIVPPPLIQARNLHSHTSTPHFLLKDHLSVCGKKSVSSSEGSVSLTYFGRILHSNYTALKKYLTPSWCLSLGLYRCFFHN